MFQVPRFFFVLTLLVSLVSFQPALAAPPPHDFVKLSRELKPAVVHISSSRAVRNHPYAPFSPFDDLFNRFYQNRPETPPVNRSLGSGFLISADGYILTNDHVVDGADDIVVKLADGRSFKAVLKGLDDKLDLALLKIDAGGDLPAVTLGNSDSLEVGEWVLAIGNPFGLEQTVTAGIVSAKGRVIGAGPYDDFIQTDASINPGNSGGPLFNLDGEVVGINSAIIANGQGIGFAIPINAAKPIVPQLKESGFVTRGWLGVSSQPLSDDLALSFGRKDAHGALVSDVIKDSPAERAGLKRGDIIIAIDGQAIRTPNDLSRIVAAGPVGKEMVIDVFRNGSSERLRATLGELEKEAPAARNGTELAETFGLIVADPPSVTGTPPAAGAIIVQIRPGSPAGEARLRPGDLIIEANGQPIGSSADFQRLVSRVKKSEPLRLLIQRDKNIFYVSLRGGR